MSDPIEKSEKHISDFMLSEYDHISTAHFESSKSIASFFRHYLLIMSAPAFIILLFNKDINTIKSLLSGQDIGINKFIAILFILISIIGFCICLYIIDKKTEVILYARTVNGIRKYFKERADFNTDQYLVLPTNTEKPSFFKMSGLYMVFPIGLINSAFVYLGCIILNEHCSGIIWAIIFLVGHILCYAIITNKKSNKVK